MKNQLRNVVLSLTSHLTQSHERPLSPKEFWTLSNQIDLNLFVDGDPIEVLKSSTEISIDNSRIISLLDRGISLALKVEQYENAKKYFMNSSHNKVSSEELKIRKPDTEKLLDTLVNKYGLIKYKVVNKINRLNEFYLKFMNN